MNSALERVERLAPEYTPSTEINYLLREITLAPIIAPTAVGKSTLIDFVVDQYDDFSRSRSFTTRPKRSNESDEQYYFLEHDKANIDKIIARIDKRELVQYAVHPTTKYLYGSDIGSYSSSYVLLDVLSSAVEPLRHIPFGSLVEVSLVCEPEVWEKRFKSRKTDMDDASKRVLEGIESIEWSLDQGEDMVWLDNSNNDLAGKADKLMGIIKGKDEGDTLSRRTGERLLKFMKESR